MVPPFFIPHANGVEQTDQVYNGIVAFHQLQNPARYYSLSYRHNGLAEVARVGEPHRINGEVVVAILRNQDDASPYLICTANRGVLRGEPILAGGGWQTIATPFTAD